MAAGFNGARLHQKIFEERFLYHADRMGYLCWGEFGDWGANKQLNAHGPAPMSLRHASSSKPSNATARTRASSAGAR